MSSQALTDITASLGADASALTADVVQYYSNLFNRAVAIRAQGDPDLTTARQLDKTAILGLSREIGRLNRMISDIVKDLR